MFVRTELLLLVAGISFVLSTTSGETNSHSQWNERVRKVQTLWSKYPDEVDKWMTKWEAAQTPYEIPEFKCGTPGPGDPPTSVHQLRPSDINVIGAFGDSVTSGNGVGADTLPGVAIENRGESWSIGVNDTIESVLTVANLIREFNPNLVGGSYSRPGLGDDRNRTHCSEIMNCAQLNVAVPGATNRDMVEQALDLIQKMKDHPDVDLENDWKLLTLFIGGNDLCAVCRRWDVYNPEYYTNSIKAAIETVKAEVPRVLFQVVTMFDITPLANMSDSIVCDIAQMGFCDCALFNETTKNIVKSSQFSYWELLDELINVNGTYDGDDSFTVVLQPHMRDLLPPFTEDGEWDKSYMAPDCFHPNLKGHQEFAYQLWNTMLTPVPEKPFVYPKEEVKEYACPTEETPYIFTNDNSRFKKSADSNKYDSKEEWNRNLDKFHSWLDQHPRIKEQWLQEWEDQLDDEFLPPPPPPFTCDVIESDEPPVSVHQLRPSDIRVIASFGDSVTSGNGVGADTLPGVAIENRGESWCIGGNKSIEEFLTIPNMLKEFNPNLVGWSYSRPGIGGDRNKTHCGRNMECAQLNLADPGGTNRDMPPQAIEIVERMREHPDVDFENDWKLITLFIGGNDLCAVCRREEYLPENYLNNIRIAIETIKAEMPRTLLQVVNMFDVTPLKNMSRGPVCNIMHNQFCDCAVYNDTVRNMLRPTQLEYWRLLDELINVNGTYNGDDSFAVVLQPHMRDLVPPVTDDGEWDKSYLSPDCFHPNAKGHHHMAYQLWNVMLTPVQEKPFVYPYYEVEDMEFKCPTEEAPFIFTNDNSAGQKKLSTKQLKQKKKVIDSVKDWNLNIKKINKWLDSVPEIKKKHIEEWSRADESIPIPPFTCDVMESDIPPTSVHQLRPSDISVVAALGDSITAGFGILAESIPEVSVQKRGQSWSIGGNQTIATILTVGNLIKEFNPDVVGWSYNRLGLGGNSNDTGCSRGNECSQLNVAIGGATAEQLPGQANMLVDRVNEHPNVDIDNDWKLVTLLIGGNDLCRVCFNEDLRPEAHVQNIKTAIDTIKENIPRVLMQVVVMFDISPLTNMSTGPACDVFHRGACSCAVNEEDRETLRPIQMEYWRLLDELIVQNGTYDNDDSFTVVLQPHMRDLIPPITEDGDYDTSFFAPDCFHPNEKGHQYSAYQLWNVMLTPVPEKPFVYPQEPVEDMAFKCPTEEAPFIFTNVNSAKTKSADKKISYVSKFAIRQIEDDIEYEKRWEKVMEAISSNQESLEEWESGNDNQDDEDLPIPPFLCDVNDLPQVPATTVHELKPSDIKVVASFGDSITAGNGLGANTKPGVAIENRGESWCIGGNQSIETVLTVPNLIKKYNPDVVGWSWSRYSRLDRNETHCDENYNCSQLNIASPGATNRGMAGQAERMIERMLDEELMDGQVDFENDWKMATLFIGGNDLCRVCENNDSYSPDAYRDGIRDALDILHASVPKMLVNLVIMFDITPLTNMSTGPVCDALHWGFCSCAIREESRKQLRGIQLEYYNKLQELVESGRYDTRDDFTVVIQPHQRDIGPILDVDGNIDHSYFSPDCFHPSRKGHHGFAYMLWNVMLMPVGQKPFAYDAYEEQLFRCPCQQHPYIFTNKNSDVDWEFCPVESKQNKKVANHPKPAVIESQQKAEVKESSVKKPVQPHLYNYEQEHANIGSGSNNQNVFIGGLAGFVGVILVAVVLLGLWYRKHNRQNSTNYSKMNSFDNPTYNDEDIDA